MTTTVTTSSNSLTANGTAPLPFTFQAISAAEVGVTRNGVETLIGFTVTLNGDNTGVVTPTSSWGTDTVVIFSKPNFKQTAGFSRFNPLYPDQVEEVIDRLMRTAIALRDSGTGGSPDLGDVAAIFAPYLAAADQSAQEASGFASGASSAASSAAQSSSDAAAAETDAATSATASATSASDALTSKNAAASSATAASTSQTAAATSATNAATSETNALSSKNAAATSATAAAASQTAAATSATNAATSATAASTSQSAAATSATNAATSETNALSSATNAGTSETNASNSALDAAATRSKLLPSTMLNGYEAFRFATGIGSVGNADAGSVSSLASASGVATARVTSADGRAAMDITLGGSNYYLANRASITNTQGHTYKLEVEYEVVTYNGATPLNISGRALFSNANYTYGTYANTTGVARSATGIYTETFSFTTTSGQAAYPLVKGAVLKTGGTSADVVQVRRLRFWDATSEAAADASATAAAASQTAAATSEANALTSKNAAATSATAAAASQTAAATSATNAATSEGNALTSKNAASTSATAAAASATNAATSETNALTSKNAAATSATNAATSATAAATSATAASTSSTSASSASADAQATRSKMLPSGFANGYDAFRLTTGIANAGQANPTDTSNLLSGIPTSQTTDSDGLPVAILNLTYLANRAALTSSLGRTFKLEVEYTVAAYNGTTPLNMQGRVAYSDGTYAFAISQSSNSPARSAVGTYTDTFTFTVAYAYPLAKGVVLKINGASGDVIYIRRMRFWDATSEVAADTSATAAAGSAASAASAVVTVPNYAATRTDLAAISTAKPVFLSESLREGQFGWDASNNSTNVGNDQLQGVYVAPSSDTTGASGAWVRRGSGQPLNVRWFGSGYTAGVPAALTLSSATGRAVYFPSGTYNVNTSLTATAIYQSFIGDGPVSALGNAQIGLTNVSYGFVHNLRLYGATDYGVNIYSTTSADYNRVNNVVIRDKVIGIRINGTTATGVGHAQLSNLTLIKNQQNLNIGDSANTMISNAVSITGDTGDYFYGAGQLKIINSSFGNPLDGHGVEIYGDATRASNESYYVNNNFNQGSRTDNQTITNIVPSSGGTRITVTTSTKHECMAGYQQYYITGTTNYNGMWTVESVTDAYTVVLKNGPVVTNLTIAPSPTYSVTETAGVFARQKFGLYLHGASGGSRYVYDHYFYGGSSNETCFENCYNIVMAMRGGGAKERCVMRGSNNKILLMGSARGRGDNVNADVLPIGEASHTGWSFLGIVDPTSTQSPGGQHTGSLAPQNAWGVGSDNKPSALAFSLTSEDGHKIGVGAYPAMDQYWQWKRASGGQLYVNLVGATAFYFSGGAFGYASGNGTGGFVTQATDKSTSVTLNRAAGQITLNSASLAAATSVSFTLTNSMIISSDVVLISIKSGASANSYTVLVDQVNNGSCRVQIRNNSAGALAEALVLNFVVIKGANS